MALIDTLGNPLVRNLLVLVTAFIGLYGSYYIYKRRLADRRDAARRALLAEIESTQILDTWVRDNSSRGTPAQIVHPTAVYEGHIEDIGLLTDEEIEHVSSFYSKASLVNDAVRWNRESELQSSLAESIVDTRRTQRKQKIASEMNRLALHRWQAAQVLRKHLGEPYEEIGKMELPESAGGTVSKYHPVIESNREELLEKEYFEVVESDTELYRLTENGEKYLEDEVKSSEEYELDHGLSLE